MGTENCALLVCYAASSGSFLPTIRDNLSAPSLVFVDRWTFQMGYVVPKRR